MPAGAGAEAMASLARTPPKLAASLLAATTAAVLLWARLNGRVPPAHASAGGLHGGAGGGHVAEADQEDGFVLQRFPTESGARCLDGSMGGVCVEHRARACILWARGFWPSPHPIPSLLLSLPSPRPPQS